MINPAMQQSSAGIDPNDLLIFASVAELGNFSRAAQRLALPKSTISRRLAALEQRLGERLLLRTTRRQSLTEFGMQLLEHARQVASEIEAVAALSERRQAAPSGRLRVSMPSDFANLLLADMLAAFVAMHPSIQLELDLSSRRVDLLGEGFDLALRIGTLPDDASLAARRLTVFSLGLYAAPGYLAQHVELAHPDDLAAHQAIRMLKADGSVAPWALSCENRHWLGTPPGRVNANSPEILIKLACAGAGIAAVPVFLAAADVQRGALQRVLPNWCLPSYTAWAMFPERKLMPIKTRVFIDMLQAALTRTDLQAAGGAASS